MVNTDVNLTGSSHLGNKASVMSVRVYLDYIC